MVILHTGSVRAACDCLPCLWRVQFAYWWDALPPKGDPACSGCSTMANDSETQWTDSVPLPPHLQGAFGGGEDEVSEEGAKFASAVFRRSDDEGDCGDDSDGSLDSAGCKRQRAPPPRQFPTAQLLEEEIESSIRQAPPVIVADSFVPPPPAAPRTQTAKPASDGTILLQVNWKDVTPQELWSIMTNPQYGRSCAVGMSTHLRHAIKMMKDCDNVPPESSGFLSAIVAPGNTKSLNNPDKNVQLKEHFEKACGVARSFVMQKMAEYCAGHPIHVYKTAARPSNCTSPPPFVAFIMAFTRVSAALSQELLPTHSDINAWARLIVVMSEPSAQQVWGDLANELRTRAGSGDDRQQSLAVRNVDLETLILSEYMNNASYTAPHFVCLDPFSLSVAVDPSKVPTPPKTVNWLRETRGDLKKLMAGTVQPSS